jgi:hypothetical protein
MAGRVSETTVPVGVYMGPHQRTARGSHIDETTALKRVVKGLVNELTPDSFERLFPRLVDAVTSAALLKHTVSEAFGIVRRSGNRGNISEDRLYRPMYAQLFYRLCVSKQEFPAEEGEESDKPITWRRILLNTFQDELDRIHSLSTVEEKMKSLGTVDLLSEMYNYDVVPSFIISAWIAELLGNAPEEIPADHNIKAVCKMIEIAGMKMAGSEPEGIALRRLEDAIFNMDKLRSKLDSTMKARIQEVLDLSDNNWVPRNAPNNARPIAEIRADAFNSFDPSQRRRIMAQIQSRLPGP